MIEKVTHLNSPSNIIGAICGDILPRFRSDNIEDVTCQFCAYAFANKVKDHGKPKTSNLRRISPPIQGKLFGSVPVLR